VIALRAPSRRMVPAIALPLVIVCGIVAMQFWPHAVLGSADRMIATARGLGGIGLAGFALLQALIALSGVLPASLLGIAAGTIYGLWLGFGLAAVSPAIERLCARRPRLRNLDARIAKDGWKLVCLLRLSPVMPFAPTSYLLGLSSIGMRDYLIGTLASLPALLGFVFLGTLADTGLWAARTGAGVWGWVAIGIGGAATLALTVYLGRIVIGLGFFGSAAAEVTTDSAA
jgi:uncharacterized membrane protein YdjX (TVP38/TMEM64 family)